jgi:hypothetical protein
MPQWAGSCWYYLRFIDPTNSQRMLDAEAEKYWMPVDLYVGGAEHAVLHLLYARFWHKVGCCAVLCCAVLCCAVLCCAVEHYGVHTPAETELATFPKQTHVSGL